MSQDTVDVSVDRNRLIEQLEQAPTDILLWSRKAVEAAEASQRAKAGLKLVEAQLAIDVRQDPTKYGFGKTTEDLIKQIVQVQPQFVDASNAVIAADGELSSVRAVLEALEHKRSSLKHIAELTVSGYAGSTPITPKGVRS